MKKTSNKAFVLYGLTAILVMSPLQPVLGGVEEECRQEAMDYGVESELRNEYISGCIESRGGTITAVSAGEDDTTSLEDEAIPDSEEAGDESAAE